MYINDLDIHQYFYKSYEALNLNRADSGYIEGQTFPEQLGEGYMKRLIIRQGLELVIADYRFWSNEITSYNGTEPLVELSYCVDGGGTIDILGKAAEIKVNQWQLWLMKDMEVSMEHASNKHMTFVGLRMTEAMFNQYMQVSPGEDKMSFANLLGSHQGYRLYEESISPAISTVIFQILQCTYEGPMKRIYLESKALELLCLSLQDCLIVSSASSISSVLRGNDLDKIKLAKQILQERMDCPPALLELSRLVGLNDYKLKVGFKEVYGTTVFGSLREMRLEKAKYYLELGMMNVSEVAYSVGYSNPSYFSEAFRRKYGVQPNLLLNRKYNNH